MRKFVIIQLLVFFVLISFLYVDNVSGESKWNSVTWDKTFGGRLEDKGFSITQTKDGGYAVAGFTILVEGRRQDIWVIKLDENGNIEWDETFGEKGPDVANSIIQTKDKGYAVAGFIWTVYASKQDIWIIKFDAIGNLEWEKTFDGDENDVAYSLIQTRDGGYVVAGSTGLRLWGETNCWVIKLDAKGNMEWDNNFGGTGWDEIYSITQITDGSFVVTGCVWSKGAGRGDVYVAKLDKRGNLVWDKTFGGSNYDEAHSIIQTEDGGYAVSGWTKSMGAGKTDVWIAKLDKRGNLVWDKTFGGSNYDEAHSIVQTEDGGYAVAGWTKSKGAGNSDAWIIKLDENGNL